MDEQELRQSVAEILEIEPVELEEKVELESFALYDSAGRLSLMVCLSDFTGKPVSVAALMELRTYGDVVELARSSVEHGISS